MFKEFKKILSSDRYSEAFDSFEETRRIYAPSYTNCGNEFSLKNDRFGFAMTFEIMLTVMLVVAFITCTVFFTSLYQTQRYFADVTSSTCTMVARYGGNNSKAYKVQVPNGGDIQKNANDQLKQVRGYATFTPNIKVSNTIGQTAGGSSTCKAGYVQVVLTYKLNKGAAGLWSMLGSFGLQDKTITQTFEVPSLVQKGKLIS